MDAPAAPLDSDEQLVTRVIEGHVPAFTWLMRRYNRRLFRVIRSVLRDAADAEDACQEAWLRAYCHLPALQRGKAFSTWLCRIGLRCALERVPRYRNLVSLDELDRLPVAPRLDEPEQWVEQRRLVDEVEHAIDRLLPAQRIVVMLRDVEQLSTGEVAEILGLTEENVRVRLHRAHARLREELAQVGELIATFAFDGERCDRLVGSVVRRIYSDDRYATRSARSFSASPSSKTAS